MHNSADILLRTQLFEYPDHRVWNSVEYPQRFLYSPIFSSFPLDGKFEMDDVKQAVIEMIIPIILPFNLLKAGINAIVTGLLFKQLEKVSAKYIIIAVGSEVRNPHFPGIELAMDSDDILEKHHHRDLRI